MSTSGDEIELLDELATWQPVALAPASALSADQVAACTTVGTAVVQTLEADQTAEFLPLLPLVLEVLIQVVASLVAQCLSNKVLWALRRVRERPHGIVAVVATHKLQRLLPDRWPTGAAIAPALKDRMVAGLLTVGAQMVDELTLWKQLYPAATELNQSSSDPGVGP